METRDEAHARMTRDALYTIAARLKTSIINKGLLLALILVVFEALLMAHYQGAAALAILRYTPPVALFTGVTANLLPLALPLMFLAGSAATGSAASAMRFTKAVSLAAATLACWVCMELFVDRALRPPLWVMLLVGVISLGAGFITYLWPEHLTSTTGGAVLEPVVVALMAVLVLGQASSNPDLRRAVSTPFLPSERVTTTTGATTTAYVLDSSSEWTTLLIDSTRTIEIVRTKDVIRREVCSVLGPGVVHPAWAVAESGRPSPTCDR